MMARGTEVARRTALDEAVAGAGLSENQVALMKRHVAKDATDDELAVMLMVAHEYGLDPLMKEIWVANFEGSNRPGAIYVGRDGLLRIAEQSGRFDGLVSGVVWTADEFELGLHAPIHKLGKDYTCLMPDGSEETRNGRGTLSLAYAYVYRKDREYPTRVVAEWLVYGKPKVRNPDGSLLLNNNRPVYPAWAKFGGAMVTKTAEAQALRKAFRVNGVLAEGEMPSDDDVVDAEIVEDPRPAPADTGEAQQPDPSAGSAEPGADDPHLFPPPDEQLEAEAAAAQNFEDIA